MCVHVYVTLLLCVCVRERTCVRVRERACVHLRVYVCEKEETFVFLRVRDDV